MSGLVIKSIAPGSAAERAGLLPGERLLAIDGQRLRDLIDYSWLVSHEEAELTVADQDGQQRFVWLEPEPGEPLGLSFAPPEPKRCGNNCVFCFVHQLPKGLRRPLYVKDEDYRLSFLQGTYVTLTNLKESELRRIIRLRLSPLYISVHATDPVVRERLLGKSNIPPILEQLTRLAAGRIQMHTQVVLCPGLNDAETLERTVSDLAALYPAVQSLAVVPVGLTSHRQRLPQLTAVDSGYAAAFLNAWLPRMRALNKRLRTPFLQLADELFLKAGHPFPPLKEYGDLPQWENGVGMVPWFQHQAAAVIKRAKPLPRPLRATLVTGRSAAGFVSDFVAVLAEKTGAELAVHAIPNRLFGESVTVTGLISGSDIITALTGQQLGELVLLPGVMLKEGEGCFLDNMTPADVSQALGCPVVSFDGTPSGLSTTLRRYAARKVTATNTTTRRRKP
jgi:putative radical SAM enzyme (TIGR03279 family)